MYVILVLLGHPLLAWNLRARLAGLKPAAATSEASQSFEPWGTSSVPAHTGHGPHHRSPPQSSALGTSCWHIAIFAAISNKPMWGA